MSAIHAVILSAKRVSTPVGPFPEWAYRKALTVNHAEVAGGVAGFPVLISLAADTDLAAGALSSGADILFTSSDGETLLPFEIETYTPATGHLTAWVRVPNLSSSVDTILYMYYGNPSAVSQEDSDGVWSGSYAMVQHLGEAPGGAAPQFTDSAEVPDAASSFGFTSRWTVGGTSNDAQAVCTDGTYIYYTSTTTLRKYTKEGVLVLSRDVMADAPATKEQVNGMYYKDGVLYISCATHATNPYLSWIAEYDPEDLTYIAHHAIVPTFSGNQYVFSEGLTFHDGSWWVIWHSNPYLSRFDTDWNHISDHKLSFPINDGSSGGYGPYSGYDGIVNMGDFFYLNIHAIYGVNFVDLYHWNGSGFDAVSRLARPTTNSAQGMGLDPSDPEVIWWAERNPAGDDGVAKGTIVRGFSRNNGTANGSPVAGSAKIENGVVMGDNRFVACGTNPRLTLQGHLTLEAWVRSDGVQTYPAIIGKIYGATSQGYVLTQGFGATKKAGGWVGQPGATAAYAVGTTDLTDGVWTHLALVYDMAKVKVYVNGVLEGGQSDSATAAIVQSTNEAVIGKYASSFDYWYNGAIDEVRIQHTARSANWLLTEFRNQNSPATFYSVGVQETR